jgi:hypothetical protein
VAPVTMSSEACGRFIGTDFARWTRIARERKIRADS